MTSKQIRILTVVTPVFTFFFSFWFHNTAWSVNSRAFPVNHQLSKTQSAAHLLAAEKGPRPPSGNAAAPTRCAQTSSVQQPASSSASPDVAPPPAASVTPVSGVGPSATTHNAAASLSQSAANVHARLGRTSKYATKDTPRMLGVKCVVDFENIYRYLSEMHKPKKECNLTPMGKIGAISHTKSKHGPKWFYGNHSG